MSELSNKQKKVMDEIFEGDEDENSVLDNNSVARRTYNIWLTEDVWIQEFDRRIEESRRRTQIIIAKFQPSAAIKLVELTRCDKEQTARQACLDIIQMPRIIEHRNIINPADSLHLSEETSDKIVELMAKDARKKRSKKSVDG